MYMLDRIRLLQNMINFAFLHQRRLRAVRKCTRKGVNRIYSCLTNSFQLSRVTAIKFEGVEYLAYIQLFAKLYTMSMQIRHDRVIFIDCRDFSVTRKTQFNIGQFHREDLYLQSNN